MQDPCKQFRILTADSLKRSNQCYKESLEKAKQEKKLIQEQQKLKTQNKQQQNSKQAPKIKKIPDTRLEGGKDLPDHLKEYFFKKKHAGKMLEDLDPYFADKRTFIVINSSKSIFRFSSTKAFFLFSPLHPLRSAAIRILTHSMFSFCVLMTIVINCMMMAKNTESETIETVFTAIYTAEFIVKAMARGLIIFKFTYLRDPWNWLDFIVIGLAYMMYVYPALGKLSALRSLRVLRALKTVTTIPGMKTVVSSLLMAIIKLRDALVLTIFMLSVFALIGLQMYRGTLLHKCVSDFDSSSYAQNLTDNEINITWEMKAIYFNDPENWQRPISFCHNTSQNSWNSTCESGYVCIRTNTGNPNFGYTSFDNFGSSLLCAFRLMTQDYWENVYQLIIRTNGDHHMLYFMLVIFFGSFYLINVILSIVAMSYDDVRNADLANFQEEMEKKLEDEEKTEQPILHIDHEFDATSEDLDFCAIEDCLYYPENVVKSCTDLRRESDEENIVPRTLNRTKSLLMPINMEAKKNEKTIEIQKTDLENDNILAYGNRMVHRTSSFMLTHHNIYKNRLNENKRKSSIFSNDDKRFSNLAVIPEMSTLSQLSTQQSLSERTRRNLSRIDSDKRGTTRSNNIQEDVEISSNLSQDADLKKRLSVLSIYEAEKKLRKRDILSLWFTETFCSWECCPAYNVCQKIVSYIVLDPFMELFITVCIVFNTVFMSIDTYDIDEQLAYVMGKANIFFMAIFTFEAVMKLIGLGPRLYFSEKWNIFDFLIVALSMTELSADKSIMSLLRTFRLLRIFKLAKSWQTMNLLFTIIGRTLGAIGNLCIVLGIIIFIFAVVGMQIFGKSYEKFTNETEFPNDYGKIPRWNFKDFTHSFMIVFRVLCGEYMESMWDCMRVNGIYCVPFFLATMILGNLVILNLFLALLLSSFSTESLQRREDESSDVNKLQEALTRVYRAAVWIKEQFLFCYIFICKKIMVIVRRHRKVTYSFPWTESDRTVSDHQSLVNKMWNKDILYANENNLNQMVWVENYEPKFNEDPEINEAEIVYWNQPTDCLPEFIVQFLSKHCNSSENCIYKGWWWIRCCAFKIVEHKFFETFILSMIALSSLTLTLEDKHLQNRTTLKTILDYMDKVFTVIFSVEMVLKWFAIGLTKYFKDAWCWLDFAIVSVALVSLHPKVNGGSFKALRTLRALRPLRAVSRWEGMKIVVNALIQAIPSIFNVLLVCLVFWLIFSIIGMQLFGGKFFKCVDLNNARISELQVPNKTFCEYLAKTYENVSWVNSKINFDNVLNGYLSLFQIATFKGWTEIMADAVDINDINLQPIYNNMTIFYIYFVLFIVFGSFFTLNLFIGVIIDNFNVQKKKIGGSLEMFMTDSQKKYYQAMKKMSSSEPQKPVPKPKGQIPQIFYTIIHNQKFDIIIMCFIMLNTVVMCLESNKQGKEMTDALDLLNKIFIVIFTTECLMKLIALRWFYFKIPWNFFDFIIVIFSIGFSILEKISPVETVSPTLIRVIRVFRIGRVLRLVKSARGIRTLLFSLVVSLPALFNIGLLLMLIMFIYAIIGVSLFSEVAYSGGIDATFNFQTFGKAMIILFQISTSGGWNTILEGLMNVDTEECKNNPKKCGAYISAVLYLVSYLVISFLVIINMYIAVILENFSQATKDVQLGLTQDDYDLFYECWEAYDPQATGFISQNDLSEFVGKLGEPLGIPQPNKIRLAMLEISIYEENIICCVDLLDKLTKNFLGEINSGNPMMDIKPKSKQKMSNKKIVISTTYLNQREIWAARKIICFLRKFVSFKKQNPINFTQRFRISN